MAQAVEGTVETGGTHSGNATGTRSGNATGTRATRVIGVLALIGVPLVLLLGLVTSPEDVEMGDSVRIMYVHVPSGACSGPGMPA
jgi:heme exporter protein C